MQYLYWCTDIIINNTNYKYNIIEPENKSQSRYVHSYIKKILEEFPNVILNNKDYDKKSVHTELCFLWKKRIILF